MMGTPRCRPAVVALCILGIILIFGLYHMQSGKSLVVSNLPRVRARIKASQSHVGQPPDSDVSRPKLRARQPNFKFPPTNRQSWITELKTTTAINLLIRSTTTTARPPPKTTTPTTRTPTARPVGLIYPKGTVAPDLQKYSGIEVLSYSPPPYSTSWSVAQLEEYYYKITSSRHAVCSNYKRIGRNGDGGWDVCLAGPYKPQAPCYSYSFGVGNIWEFDEQTVSVFGCKVRTFDPTMHMGDHQHSHGVLFFNLGISGTDGIMNGWSVLKFSSMLKRFKDQNKIIDIVKMDVEYSEWNALEAMFSDGSLTNVKQLLMETHTSEVQSRQTSKEDLLRFIRIQQKLEELGFRRWKYHWNHFGNYNSGHTGRSRTCCYEHYYININFLRKGVKVRNDAPTSSAAVPKVKITTHQFQALTYKPMTLNNGWSNQLAENAYHSMMQTDHAKCPTIRRIGRQGDGGWDVCLTSDTKPTSPCLVYSFGVNYIWEFDDQLASEYQCEVLAFDPSMSTQTHKRRERLMFYREGLGGQDMTQSNGWKLNKLSSLLRRFHHQDKVVDILKIDIEHWEWDSLESALSDSALDKVRQLVFETHTDEVGGGPPTSAANYLRYMRIWQGLYKVGFRQWQHHWNHFGNYQSQHTGQSRTCCHEHYLVNINLLKVP